MKRCRIFFTILLFCIFSIAPITAKAEMTYFAVVETMLNEIVDCSEKQFIQLSASEYDPDTCILFIDYTEGNYSIVAVDGETAMLVYYDFQRYLKCWHSRWSVFHTGNLKTPNSQRV